MGTSMSAINNMQSSQSHRDVWIEREDHTLAKTQDHFNRSVFDSYSWDCVRRSLPTITIKCISVSNEHLQFYVFTVRVLMCNPHV